MDVWIHLGVHRENQVSFEGVPCTVHDQDQGSECVGAQPRAADTLSPSKGGLHVSCVKDSHKFSFMAAWHDLSAELCVARAERARESIVWAEVEREAGSRHREHGRACEMLVSNVIEKR